MLANHAPAANDSPQGDSDQSLSDYDTILAALMESARGRSFLQEYGLRNRVADTTTLLTAIGRIEGLLTSRSLEPAGATDAAPPSDGVAALAVEPALVEPPGADPEAIEIEIEFDIAPAPQAVEIESIANAWVAIETQPAAIATPEPMPPEIAALDGTALQVLAIEFLGPDLRGLVSTPIEPATRDIPARAEQRDPFAEIRALSDIEKIAVFT